METRGDRYGSAAACGERPGSIPGLVHHLSNGRGKLDRDVSEDTLVIYSFMFPRYSGDTRPGPPEGETARLRMTETPCPSCTSILDSLDGAAPHLAWRLNLAVVAKCDPDRIRNFARERGWHHLRLLSS